MTTDNKREPNASPDYSDLYQQINALDARDFNTCFYCGCIATEYDLVPPLKHALFYLKTAEEADFYKVPACRECFHFLKADNSALLGQRVDKAKRCLARKYQRAIHIYNVWQRDEIDELDYQLQHSVNAGMILGEESLQRVQYQGFHYEVDGAKQLAHFVEHETFTIFGERFDHFRDALTYASKAYRIPKATLITLFRAHDDSFEHAINTYNQEQAEKLLEKTLAAKCKDFATSHKQNSKFVIRTIKAYCAQDEHLSIEMALDKLYREVIVGSRVAKE